METSSTEASASQIHNPRGSCPRRSGGGAGDLGGQWGALEPCEIPLLIGKGDGTTWFNDCLMGIFLKEYYA